MVKIGPIEFPNNPDRPSISAENTFNNSVWANKINTNAPLGYALETNPDYPPLYSTNINDSTQIANQEPVTRSFDATTNAANLLRYQHQCPYMDTAQNYLGIRNTKRPVSGRERGYTQLRMVGSGTPYNMSAGMHWCGAAAHLVMKEGGIRNLPSVEQGKSVQGWINWAGQRYHHFSKENGGNISKSVDEAITQMKEIEDHPRLVAFCENIYDACYQDLISRGADPIEAAVKASEIAIRAQREFRD